MLAMCMFAFCFSAVAKRCGFALLETDACAVQETINEVSFFWRPMLARPVTNGNVFVFGMKDTAEIECEQANGNLCAEFFHWTCLI